MALRDRTVFAALGVRSPLSDEYRRKLALLL
jgi:thioredoxin-like negative regulator of GroEL